MSGQGGGRGVGLQEKEIIAKDMPTLFGAGGHQDGATALIRTNENTRTEEDLALAGMGERVIDENVIPNNVSNVNTEFNFAYAKTGAAHPVDGQVIDKSFARISTGLASGDTNVDTGPGANAFELTLQALQSSFGHHYNMDAGRGPTIGGANPFASAPNQSDPFSGSTIRRGDMDMQEDRSQQPESESDKSMQQSVDFFLSTPASIVTSDGSDNFNENNGLRRKNTKTSQSRQLERVGQRDDIMKAVEKSVELHADVMAQHFAKSFKTDLDRSNIYNRIHNPLNLYTANQVGVDDISSETFRARAKRGKKSNSEKMKSTLVGV
jgi:hypothetical protein